LLIPPEIANVLSKLKAVSARTKLSTVTGTVESSGIGAESVSAFALFPCSEISPASISTSEKKIDEYVLLMISAPLSQLQ
jgi:hypothetical protein